MPLLPEIPNVLVERGGAALQWEPLRERLALGALSQPGRAFLQALEPSSDLAWIEGQQRRNGEMARFLRGGEPFDFRGVFDLSELLDQGRIEGSALQPLELRAVLVHAERTEAWRQLVLALPPVANEQDGWSGITELTAPLLPHDLENLLRGLRGKIEPDGSLADNASTDLARIRRQLERQHRAIEESLRRALAKLADAGSTQDALITVRGERFVIPVKAEFKRRIGGVIHGSSSSGQTVFVEPMETIEQNNEMARLLDEEQAEIHRILVAMTRLVAAESEALRAGAMVLAQADAHQAVGRFALDLNCVRPAFGVASEEPVDDARELDLQAARHPLLELRLRASGGAVVPLAIALPAGSRQMIVSGPNTGGKTVALKTAGLLALMAQAGLPVPAARARLPLFTAIYADIGDAQSIEQNLSTFSAHVVNVERIAQHSDRASLVLLDELGSATDPEEGAALAVAVAGHFLRRGAWCLITTHLTALKVYAAEHAGVLNAAVGFDEATLTPTYDLRLGVPGASAGLNIAARLGLDPAIVAEARAQMSSQQIDIGRFLDELHAQLTAANAERVTNATTARLLAREREQLQAEGRKEQQARTQALERQLADLIRSFETQLRETVKAIDDKTIAQKIARDSSLRLAQLRREFSEQFQTAVEAHDPKPGADTKEARQEREPRAGDLVRLRSLNGREGRVERVIDAKYLEVSFGTMKTRVPRTDVTELTPVVEPPPGAGRRRGGIHVSHGGGGEDDSMSSEINVIGRTADEAESEVDRFVERAFLAGLPRVRVVHGVGMGILRRTLREFLRNHPHVVSVAEPPYNEGGQGATMVELRQ